MRNKLYSIIGIIVCFGLAKGCIKDHLKGSDKNVIANYEKMISDNSITTAVLSREYKEVTIKILGLPAKSYHFNYHYSVNGIKYNGTHSFDHVPTGNTVQVYYLKSDPGFNTVDPQNLLVVEKKKSSSNENLYWGIGWSVLCLGTIIGFIKELKEKKVEAEPEVSVA